MLSDRVKRALFIVDEAIEEYDYPYDLGYEDICSFRDLPLNAQYDVLTMILEDLRGLELDILTAVHLQRTDDA